MNSPPDLLPGTLDLLVLRTLWRFRAQGAELEEELSFHREAIERELVTRGQSPADARAAARRAMGTVTLMREDARAVWPWLEGVGQDARGTLRGLRRSPAFSTGVMPTFALGVGANAAMFSFLDRQMFHAPALMCDAASVHRVYLYKLLDGVETENSSRYARHADLERWMTSFSAVAGFTTDQLAVGVGQNARELRVGIVTASFFNFFDAPPAAGRYFTAAEARLAKPVVGGLVSTLATSRAAHLCDDTDRDIPSSWILSNAAPIGLVPGTFALAPWLGFLGFVVAIIWLWLDAASVGSVAARIVISIQHGSD